MNYITKTAQELKFGDIVSYVDARSVIVAAYVKLTADGSMIKVMFATQGEAGIKEHYFALNTPIQVEAPEVAVTAEELYILVEAASDLLSMDNSGEAGNLLDDARHKRLIELVARLAPPPPPTAEELADMLREMVCANSPEVTARAKAMLCRRFGK